MGDCNYRYCIKTELSENSEIYAECDELEHTPSGGLALWHHVDGKRDYCVLAIANGYWSSVYAADWLIGDINDHIQSWKGEMATG